MADVGTPRRGETGAPLLLSVRQRGARLLIVLALLLGAMSLPAAAQARQAGDAPPSQPTTAPAWDAPHAENELLVKLAPGANHLALPGGAILVREIPALGLALVRMPAGKGLRQAAAELSESTTTEWAEPNYTIGLDFVPNDPKYESYQRTYLTRMGTEAAWDLTEGRRETIIAVLDTGVDMEHEDLAGAIWTNPGEIPGNKIDDDGNGFVDDVHGWDFASNDNVPDDDHGHGTHVSGIAAARIDNGIGIAGIAGRATVMPVDVFQGGIGTYEALIRAIVYATDNGARVINMSLGASSYSKGEEAAVDYAYSHGVVLVAAAGNSGREEQHYPARHVHVIAVASTTSDDYLSPFSSRGDWVDVAAPGSSVFSTTRYNNYGYMSGTSMATPQVSGLAALMLSRNPKLTPDQVRSIVESTADDLGPVGRDIYFGAGRINAGRALAATALDTDPPPVHQPGPGLDMDLPGCTQLIGNGGFEGGTEHWEMSGPAVVVTDTVSTGNASLRFASGPSVLSTISQTLVLPSGATAAILRFDYRIDPQDYGRGSSPAWPFDDWFTADWRTASGTTLGRLLLTGNTADTIQAGLEWDHYIYRLEATDLEALAASGPVKLVFTSQNDSDSYPTDIWVDSVSFCAAGISYPNRSYLPQLGNP